MQVTTQKRQFASGAEAVAHYYRRGFSRVAMGAEELPEGIILMDDGINIVRIKRQDPLKWVATEHWVED